MRLKAIHIFPWFWALTQTSMFCHRGTRSLQGLSCASPCVPLSRGHLAPHLSSQGLQQKLIIHFTALHLQNSLGESLWLQPPGYRCICMVRRQTPTGTAAGGNVRHTHSFSLPSHPKGPPELYLQLWPGHARPLAPSLDVCLRGPPALPSTSFQCTRG